MIIAKATTNLNDIRYSRFAQSYRLISKKDKGKSENKSFSICRQNKIRNEKKGARKGHEHTFASAMRYTARVPEVE
ncbi:MAG: hypothetical protein IKA23_00590 [Akkermansia sp.]|nr:hypothetical protein [Akkermansia sp.]